MLGAIDRSGQITTEYKYDQFGNRIESKVTGGTTTIVTKSEFDAFGRQTSETDPLGNTKHYEYDSQGRLTAVILPSIPDPACGTVSDPCTLADFENPPRAAPRYEYGYDAQGSQTLIRDPSGRETHFTFDAVGNQLSRTLPLGVESSQAGDFTETFSYDLQGRPTLHVSFEGVITRFQYDAETGRVAEKHLFANTVAYNSGSGTPDEIRTFAYDAFGRESTVVQTVGSVARSVSKSYDSHGRLIRVASPEGVINYEYDNIGRKSRTTVTSSNPDGSDNVVHDYRYEHDALGRLSKVTVLERNDVVLSSPELTTYQYDPAGNLFQQTTPDGGIADYQYDHLFRLDKLIQYLPDGTVSPGFTDHDLSNNAKLASYDYDLRADGKRTGVSETNWFDSDSNGTPEPHVTRIDWSYDNAGRLIDQVFNHHDDSLDFTAHYDFDLVGNRMAKRVNRNPAFDGNGTPTDTIADELVSYLYDANDRLLAQIADNIVSGAPDPATRQTTTYGWGRDNSGTQQTSKTVSDSAGSVLSVVNYSYDLQGRMQEVASEAFNNGKVSRRERITYDYDDEGIRVSALHETDADPDGTYESRVKTQYLIDHQNFTSYQQVLDETLTDADSGEVQKRIVYTIGLDQISQTTFTAGGATEGETLVFHVDGHGSTRILTTLASAIATLGGQRQIFAYDAYGNAIGFNASAAVTTLLYNNEHFDAPTGQYYFRARSYDPLSGRFPTLDPYFGDLLSPQSLHKHAFVHGDPVNGIDPTGEFFTLVSSFVSTSIRTVMNNKKVVASIYVADRASTIVDAVKFVASLAATGTVNPGLLAGLLISLVPFGKVFAKAKLVFNSGGDLFGFLSRGGVGYLDNSASALTDAYRGIKSTSGLAGKKLTQTAGELGAAVTAKKLGLEAIEDFPTKYHGIDALYKHGDSIVIVEAKGYASAGSAHLGRTKAGEQLSRGWIDQQIDRLRNAGDRKWADLIDSARTSGNLKVLAVASPVDDAAQQMLNPKFVLKNWDDIGPTAFGALP